MAKKRKALSKSVRFAIFARDQFQCRYCGRQSDTVKLVIDHIIPFSKGGNCEPENLITSCEDCNQGKSDKTIQQCVPTESDRLRLAQELKEQMESIEIARKLAEVREETRQSLVDALCKAYSVDRFYKNWCNADVLYRFFVQHGPVVFEWIEIAAARVRISQAGRYICGIRRKYIQEGGK